MNNITTMLVSCLYHICIYCYLRDASTWINSISSTAFDLLTSLSFRMRTSSLFVMTKEIYSFSSNFFWIIWDNFLKVKFDLCKSISMKKAHQNLELLLLLYCHHQTQQLIFHQKIYQKTLCHLVLELSWKN